MDWITAEMITKGLIGLILALLVYTYKRDNSVILQKVESVDQSQTEAMAKIVESLAEVTKMIADIKKENNELQQRTIVLETECRLNHKS